MCPTICQLNIKFDLVVLESNTRESKSWIKSISEVFDANLLRSSSGYNEVN